MFSRKQPYTLRILVGLIILGMAAIIVFLRHESNDSQQQYQEISIRDVPSETTDTSVSNKTSSIATEWQWNNFSSDNLQANTDKSETKPQFDADYIYNALKSVKLDENGDVITDHQALLALNETLAYSGLQLDRESLAELQEIIKLGLPGEAGEQTAEVVGNYYQYLDAEREFNTLYNAEVSSTDPKAQYEELLALRELYLGKDIADSLFEISNANARYMFESFRIKADSSLTDEEKRERQLENVDHHIEQTTGVPN
jgi:lipase chaperone protein